MQVKIKSIKLNNGWYNLVDESGKEISVMAEKNPILKPILEALLVTGTGEAEMEVKEKNGKNYGWDIKAQSGGKPSFVAKDTKRETALQCASRHTSIGQSSPDEILKIADKYYAWLKQ